MNCTNKASDFLSFVNVSDQYKENKKVVYKLRQVCIHNYVDSFSEDKGYSDSSKESYIEFTKTFKKHLSKVWVRDVNDGEIFLVEENKIRERKFNVGIGSSLFVIEKWS
ncbi:MAG: hypothetical protein ACRCSZ_10980 [Lactococcus lactis]